jgi:2,5-furandicarboxylate decarboxylase 1
MAKRVTKARGTEEAFDLQACLARLEAAGMLARVRALVDPRFELCGVAKRLEGSRVVLFERVKGSDFPVVIGLFWNRQNLAHLFGCSEPRLPFLLEEAIASWQREPVPPVVVDDAPAQEVVYLGPALAGLDLTGLPVPVHALGDGGPFLSCSVVIAKDPDTGVRNASVHRCMITGPARMTMLMDEGRHLRDYYERAEARGQALEVTINNGVDPAVYFAAVTPASAAPMDQDELGIASALRGRPLELVPGRTVAVEAVAAAQIVIEGEILPAVREPEGPFGEVTGYYAERADRWVVRVKAITHRAKPVFHTLLPGREVFNSVGLTGEASLFRLLSRQVPGIRDVYLSHGGCGFYHAVVQLDPRAPGMAKQAILAAFAAFPPLLAVTVVDPDVDPRDAEDVQWAMTTRFRPDRDLVLVPGAAGHELNPMVEDRLAVKVGYDATVPFPRSPAFERVRMQDVQPEAYDIV